MGGGGYVTGLVIHPSERDVMYAKADISGVFRWEAATESWTSLMDFLPTEQWNDYGTEAIAIDPSNPDVLYVATGNYDDEWAPPGKIYRSDDRGETFEIFSPDWSVKMGGGKGLRGTGERLAVSPSNPDVVLFGSRRAGLWRTADGGATWNPQTFTGLDPEYGIQSLLFDPKTPGTVYGTFRGIGVQKSTDDGATWAPIPGGPTVGSRMALTRVPGELWVSYDQFPGHADGGVAKLFADGSWTTSEPAGRPYGMYNAIAVNPADDLDIIAAPGETYIAEQTYRSRDGGASWAPIDWRFDSRVPFVDATGAEYGEGWWTAEQAAFAFDPHRANTFWTTNYYFTSRTSDLDAATPTLTNPVSGLENTVALALTTNASGQLISGLADTGGFFHDNGVDSYPSDKLPVLDGQPYSWNATTGLTAFPGDRDIVFRVGSNRGSPYDGLGRSTDGGATWDLVYDWEDIPGTGQGKPLRVAVSPTDADNLVVARWNAPTQFTTDGGSTWTDSLGAGTTPAAEFYWGTPLVADGARAGTFYWYDDVAQTVARSTDGGRTFDIVEDGLINEPFEGDRNGYLAATPGVEGDLYLALEDNGLRHSTDGGETWETVASVTSARTVSVGAAPGPDLPPAVYVYGDLDGQRGIWMSLDSGATWTNIQQPDLQIGSVPNTITASETEFGRVFIGTSGRGIFTYTPGAIQRNGGCRGGR
jgi:hypothetical protein